MVKKRDRNDKFGGKTIKINWKTFAFLFFRGVQMELQNCIICSEKVNYGEGGWGMKSCIKRHTAYYYV